MANTMKTKEKAKLQAEAKERLKKEPRLGDYKKKAEKLSADPHKNDAEKIRKLKGGKSLEKQVAAVHSLEITLDKLLKRLNEKGVNLSNIKTAKDLQREVTKNSLSLNVAEAVLVERLPEITSGDGSAGEHIGEMLKEKSNKLWVVKSLSNLRGNEPLSKQKDAVAILDQAMVKLIAKLAKADADISGIDRPSKLKDAIRKHNIETTEQEKAAILAFTRMSASNGETAKYVKKEWSKTREAGVEASKGYFDKYMEHFNKNPAGTAALSVAAVAGAYLTAKALLELGKWAIGSEDKDEKKGKGKLNKKVVVATIAAVAGLFFGRGKVKEMFASVGLDFFDMEKQIEEGKEFTAEQKKKIKKGGSAIKKKVGEMKKEAAKKRVRTGAGAAVESAGVGVVESPDRVEPSKSKELTEVAGELDENAKYSAPRNLLISAFCLDPYTYSPQDKDQIKWAIHPFKSKNINDILKLYRQYKAEIDSIKKPNEDLNGAGVPRNNGLVKFPDTIIQKNLNATIRILGTSIAEYKKRRPNVNFSGVTLETFFEEYIYTDSVLKINDKLKEAISSSISLSNITSITKLGDIDLDGIQEGLKTLGKDHMEDLASDYGVDLSSVNKPQFTAIMSSLLADGTLEMDSKTAVSVALKDSSKYDAKTLAAAEKFFTEIKKETLGNIIPAAIERFSIKDPRNNANKDILKKHLNAKMGLNKALILALVTRSIDLKKSPKEGSSEAQELAFLFATLSIIPKDHKKNYLSELIVILAQSPSSINMPSLALIQPYFGKMVDIGIYKLKNELKGATSFLSAIAPDRTEKQIQGDLRKLRDKDLLDFATEGGVQSLSGGFQLGKDMLMTIWASGEVAAEDWQHCETPWDYMKLLGKAGCTFIWNEDENGRGTGMVQFLGRYFVFRPYGVVKETFSAAFQEGKTGGDRSIGAFKVYTVGAAPFVTFGAAHGFLKAREGAKGWLFVPRIKGAAKGAAKGFAFPYYAFKGVKKGVETAASGVVATSEYTGRSARAFRITGRRVQDIVSKRTLRQNIPNMLENGRWMEHYVAGSKNVVLGTREKLDALRHDPKKLLRRLAGSFNERMAARYTDRFIHQYNHFFDFDAGSDASIKLGNTREALVAKDRVRRFMTSMKDSPDTLDKIQKIAKNGLKGEALSKASTELLKKVDGLLPGEYEALAKQLRTKGDVGAFIKRMEVGLSFQPKSAAIAAEKMAAKALAALDAKEGVKAADTLDDASDVAKKANKINDVFDTTRKFGEVADEIAGLEKELVATSKKITEAQHDMNTAKSIGIQKRVDDAREMMQSAKIAKTRIEASIDALKKVGTAEKELAAITETSGKVANQAYIKLLKATDLAEDALDISKEATQSIGKLGKLGTGLKWGFRGLAGFGAGFSAFQAVSAGHEALTTDNKERAGVKGIEAGLWTVNAVADTAAVAVMFGVGGTAAGTAAAAFAPLIPITYVGETILENEYEKTLTAGEWAQKNPYELLHHFYTSVNSVSLADAWEAGFKSFGGYAALGGLPGIALGSAIEKKSTDKEVEKIEATKVQTLQKIYRALIAMESDPSLMQYMNKTKASPEKDKEVERRIDKAYTANHSFFFRENNKHGIESNMGSYASARRMIMDAQIFNRIMDERDLAKKAGRPFMIGNIDLTEDRYEIIGGVEDPKWQGEKAYSPQVIVNVYKRLALKDIEGDVVIADNLEKMDSPYLLRLLAQMRKALSDKSRSGELDEIPGLKKDLFVNYILISNYLNYKRNVDVDRALGNYGEPIMTAKEISKHLSGFGKLENKAYADFEKQTPKTPALHAMYRLAEYFGYNGVESEENLKAFFTEDAGKYRGVYWDGSEWVVAEAGWESDDELGSELTTSVVKKIIKAMREAPDNILEHRSDTRFMDAYDYSAEVLGMAAILDKGLKEGAKRGYERKSEELKKEIVEAPVAFNPKKIDYNKASPELKKDYYKAIEHVIASTGWRQLRNNVRDDHTIDLSRGDNKGKTRLYREGNKWNVDGFQGGLDLLQAITLGNLKNKIHDMKEGAGSNRPFELDDGVIQFDRNWSFIETDVLSDKQGWLSFFDEIGLSKQKVVSALNNWVETGDDKRAFAEKSRRDRIERDKKSSTKARS